MKSADQHPDANVAERPSLSRRPGRTRPDYDVRAAALRTRMLELQAAASTDEDSASCTARPGVTSVESAAVSRSATCDTVEDDQHLTTRVRLEDTPIDAVAGSASLPEPVAIPLAKRLGHFARSLNSGPGWLASGCVHTVLLVILALLVPKIESLRPPIAISSGKAIAEEAPLIVKPLELATAPKEHAFSDLSFGVADARPDDSSARPLDYSPDEPASFSASAILGDRVDTDLGMAVLRSAGNPDQQGGAQFFGVQARGDSFTFIVDRSSSMTMKFADTVRELEAAIRRLEKHQKFYVIFFSNGEERMKLFKWNRRHTRYRMSLRAEPALVPATEENIEGCVKWMKTIQPEGRTNPHDATKFAIRDLRPDAIFLLSDGEFNEGGITEAYLAEHNILKEPEDGKRVRSIVHCIGFYSRLGEMTLRRIADFNGGTYRFVAPPVR